MRLPAVVAFSTTTVLALAFLQAQDRPTVLKPAAEEHLSDDQAGEVNWLTGEGVNAGGILTPELFLTGAWGAFEPGSGPGDFATTEHDPQVNGTLQAIELHLLLNVNDVVTGGASGFAHEVAGYKLEAELEEAFLHYQVTEGLAIGGGQFLNALGFQNARHLHDWDFVNQNLVNSRMLNEGHLITQGGEVLVSLPGSGSLTLGGGGVFAHAQDHGEEHAGHGEEGEEHRHLEAHEAAFNDWVFSANASFQFLPDKSLKTTTSFVAGENGFSRNTFAYGAGLQKVWSGHEDGDGGPDFSTGALLFRTEFLGREVEALHNDEEETEELTFDDYGFSTGLFYGLTDRVTLALRHDWVSEVEEAELADVHRISPALACFLGPNQRLMARLQYDFIRSDATESEHAGWFQLQWNWGGQETGHHSHSHGHAH